MSNHTPGPWIVGGEKLRDPNCIIIHTGKGESIASVWNLMHSDGSEPNTPLEANAALIAAAPELLAACKMAMELTTKMGCIVFDGPPPDCMCLGCHTNRLARAAIAKAEGRS